MLPDFSYVQATSVNEAVRELAAKDAHVYAGGTDLLGCLRDGVFGARKVVAIGGIKELRGIGPTTGGTRIGPLTTLADVAANPLIREKYTALSLAAASAASPQLRNQGTIGGNLCQRPRCWYFRSDFNCLRKGGDTCYAPAGENEYHCIFGGAGCYMVHPSDTAAALVALDARVRISGPRGSRAMPIESFFVPPSKDHTKENVLMPGEILTEILLPASDVRSFYRKVRVRASFDFALAGVAVAVRKTGDVVNSARIALSGVAPVPWRAQEAEKVLAGKRLDNDSALLAAARSIVGAEPLSQNEFKIDLVRGIVEEALLALA